MTSRFSWPPTFSANISQLGNRLADTDLPEDTLLEAAKHLALAYRAIQRYQENTKVSDIFSSMPGTIERLYAQTLFLRSKEDESSLDTSLLSRFGRLTDE